MLEDVDDPNVESAIEKVLEGDVGQIGDNRNFLINANLKF